MLLVTKTPLKCGRNNPQHHKHLTASGPSRIPMSGVIVFSAEKELPGGDVMGDSYGVKEIDGRFYVFRFHEDFDARTETLLSGPHSEKEAECIAFGMATFANNFLARAA